MSKLTRALVLGAILAAMNLAGMTAVAHAQATDEPTGKQAARRPPTQGQVGEAWHQPQVAPQERRRGRRPPAAAGPRARSASPGDTRPGVAPAAGRTERAARLAHRSLGVLAAALALAGGLAVLAAKRPGRRTRVGHST